mmetsp:Transcript_9267/g.13269  ORF Transcript_9267/g.13269 Transcript_9267/m.13269 type:complete len:252 (+) Transcript_9267:2-757(+)
MRMYLSTILVMVGSATVAIALTFWIKKFVNRDFPVMQAVDIGLAAADFGSDIKFIVDAFSATSPTDVKLAWLSLSFLVVAGVVSFSSSLIVVHYFWKRRAKKVSTEDVLDWFKVKDHSNLFGIIAVLTIADIELIKLYPWKKQFYDGFPEMRVAVIVTGVAMVEDVPQLIIQLISIIANQQKQQFSAIVSMAITITSICWRVAKRSLKLMGVGAIESLSHETSIVSTTTTVPPKSPVRTFGDAPGSAEVKV